MGKETEAPRAGSTGAALTCEEITALVVDYVTETLEPETALAFEDHLRNCPDCIAFFNTYTKTIQATRSLRYEDISPAMEARVRQFLLEKIKKFPRIP